MDQKKIPWERPSFEIQDCFLSMAHATRLKAEKKRNKNVFAEQLYEQCIRMSSDECAVKFLATMKSKEGSVTMLTTDSKEVERIDDRTLRYVGE
jgi:hypothetical protein